MSKPVTLDDIVAAIMQNPTDAHFIRKEILYWIDHIKAEEGL